LENLKAPLFDLIEKDYPYASSLISLYKSWSAGGPDYRQEKEEPEDPSYNAPAPDDDDIIDVFEDIVDDKVNDPQADYGYVRVPKRKRSFPSNLSKAALSSFDQQLGKATWKDRIRIWSKR
jgi:hypothetical protein